MNKANIQKLIDHLRKSPEENFSMMRFVANFPSHRKVSDVLEQMETTGGCGTTACIAGHAILLKAVEDDDRLTSVGSPWKGSSDVASRAASWLGLTITQAKDLFYELDSRITIADVIPVLEHLRDTGEVNWSLSGHWEKSFIETLGENNV